MLRVDDSRDAIEGGVHKYDAFLNLLCADRYAFQRDAVRTALRFLVSDKYPDLERLALENWNNRDCIRQRHENGLDAFLGAMPLRDCKAVTLDLATGAGKSFVMYGLAAVALAEGLVDRVLVLYPPIRGPEGTVPQGVPAAGRMQMIFQDFRKQGDAACNCFKDRVISLPTHAPCLSFVRMMHIKGAFYISHGQPDQVGTP